jgi:4-hydroxy-tetrahydrodipicolinate synthase
MFKGSNVALITPFKNNGLDEEAYIKLIHFHMDNGTSGLVPAGTTESLQHLVIKNIRELLIYV